MGDNSGENESLRGGLEFRLKYHLEPKEGCGKEVMGR